MSLGRSDGCVRVCVLGDLPAALSSLVCTQCVGISEACAARGLLLLLLLLDPYYRLASRSVAATCHGQAQHCHGTHPPIAVVAGNAFACPGHIFRC